MSLHSPRRGPALVVGISILVGAFGCSTSPRDTPPPLIQLEVLLNDRPQGRVEVPDRPEGVALGVVLRANDLPTTSLRVVELTGAGGRTLRLSRPRSQQIDAGLRFVRREGVPAVGLVAAAHDRAQPTAAPSTRWVLHPDRLTLLTSDFRREDNRAASPRAPLRVVVDGRPAPRIELEELKPTPTVKEPGRAHKRGSWHLRHVAGLRLSAQELARVRLESATGAFVEISAAECLGDELHFVHPNKRGTWTYKAYLPARDLAARAGRPEPIEKLQDVEVIRISSRGESRSASPP